ncbi:MAG: hypothetical protein MI920_15700 [Kiloniellales bacterium]|nr:hypothetical protein [Kiloniellales bacterium]
MSRKSQFLLVIVLGLLVLGGVFVLTWEIPPPSTQVEKVIPNDRFAR